LTGLSEKVFFGEIDAAMPQVPRRKTAARRTSAEVIGLPNFADGRTWFSWSALPNNWACPGN